MFYFGIHIEEYFISLVYKFQYNRTNNREVIQVNIIHTNLRASCTQYSSFKSILRLSLSFAVFLCHLTHFFFNSLPYQAPFYRYTAIQHTCLSFFCCNLINSVKILNFLPLNKPVPLPQTKYHFFPQDLYYNIIKHIKFHSQQQLKKRIKWQLSFVVFSLSFFHFHLIFFCGGGLFCWILFYNFVTIVTVTFLAAHIHTHTRF